jgi:hypothetical protein
VGLPRNLLMDSAIRLGFRFFPTGWQVFYHQPDVILSPSIRKGEPALGIHNNGAQALPRPASGGVRRASHLGSVAFAQGVAVGIAELASLNELPNNQHTIGSAESAWTWIITQPFAGTRVWPGLVVKVAWPRWPS